MVKNELLSPQRRETLLRLAKRVSSGHNPKEVVAELVGVRGHQAPASFSDPPKRQDIKPFADFLGELRPKDQFSFVSRVPYRDVLVGVKYTVIPVLRGWISFTDGTNVFFVRLRDAFDYEVSTFKNHVRGRISLIAGDRVRHVVSKKVGTVICVDDELCDVEFDDESLNVEPNNTTRLHYSLVDLEEKDSTTQGYIQRVDDNIWRVSFAKYQRDFKSQRDALADLERNLKVGFLRFSKLAASDPKLELENRSIEFLMTMDPKVWGHPNPYIRRGIVQKKATMDDVRKAVLPKYE